MCLYWWFAERLKCRIKSSTRPVELKGHCGIMTECLKITMLSANKVKASIKCTCRYVRLWTKYNCLKYIWIEM